MIFNFLVLIHLAIVNTIGSSNPSLNPYLVHQLPDNCSPFIERTMKHFDSCRVSVRKPVITYGSDAVPYMCLLSLDVAAELCKQPELLKFHPLNSPESVCPMGYALETTNLNINITQGVKYMSNEENCNGVCKFSEDLLNICQFIALANEILKEGKSIGKNLDRVKGDDNQSVHSVENVGTDHVTGGSGINEYTKFAQETKPKVSPKPIHEIVQDMTSNKSDINKPVTKTGGDINKTTKTADLGLKPDLESNRPDVAIYKNNNSKAMSGSDSFNASMNKTISKNDTSKNHDNYKIKQIEMNKSQDLASNKGNAEIPVTESPPPPQSPLENDYSSKNQQNNGNIINNNNNNVNSNNNNVEFEDDPALKTPHEEGEDDDDNNNEDMDKSPLQDTLLEGEPQFAKSVKQKEIYSGDNFFQAEDSHFSTYFLTTVSIIIIGYIIYHNKKKILAYALEGRRKKNGRRRPTSASYRKLDCNLEEAIASNPSNTSVTNVVY